jgi:biopolymer transport protein ExbD
MKFQRNLKSTNVHIDLTSLIDVVFILLLFFILTTSFSRESVIRINLPQANGEAATTNPVTIDVLVANDGTFAVNGRTLATSNVDSLMQAITDIAAGDNMLPVLITADADTSHQSVVTAMDAVARLGFSKLSIATRTPEAVGE